MKTNFWTMTIYFICIQIAIYFTSHDIKTVIKENKTICPTQKQVDSLEKDLKYWREFQLNGGKEFRPNLDKM